MSVFLHFSGLVCHSIPWFCLHSCIFRYLFLSFSHCWLIRQLFSSSEIKSFLSFLLIFDQGSFLVWANRKKCRECAGLFSSGFKDTGSTRRLSYFSIQCPSATPQMTMAYITLYVTAQHNLNPN